MEPSRSTGFAAIKFILLAVFVGVVAATTVSLWRHRQAALSSPLPEARQTAAIAQDARPAPASVGARGNDVAMPEIPTGQRLDKPLAIPRPAMNDVFEGTDQEMPSTGRRPGGDVVIDKSAQPAHKQ